MLFDYYFDENENFSELSELSEKFGINNDYNVSRETYDNENDY